MLIRQLALVTETHDIDIAELSQVSAALQKQVARDFAPIWDVQATVDVFARLEDVPLGYWRIIVVDEVETGAGVHRDHDGQPFALVEKGSSWSLTASHEALEMLADPSGDRVVAGFSPVPAHGRVEFLVEVCDPCEDDANGYTVNGVLVSDFCTPSYFDPKRAPGVRYSFRGSIQEPREVLPGGYLSWRDPVSAHWFQLRRAESGEPELRDLGMRQNATASLRSWIDSRTPEHRRLCRLPADRDSIRKSDAERRAIRGATAAQAETLRREIARVTAD